MLYEPFMLIMLENLSMEFWNGNWIEYDTNVTVVHRTEGGSEEEKADEGKI